MYSIQGSLKMLCKVALILCVLQLVCGQTESPKPVTPFRPKQFRYVDDNEPHDRPTAERQEASSKTFVVPNSFPTANQEVYPPEYPSDPDRPLVSVNTKKDDSGLGHKTDVGVNVGPFVQLDVNRESTIGQRALNLGLNVLNGLVKVNVKRDRDPFGRRGPIQVQVGGLTVYDNGQ